MITVRRSADRGRARTDWLDSHHTFSFADYVDPKHMGFGKLRVINDDLIAPSRGFGMHPHRDMEIVTYVVAGAIQHKDSMGNGSVIRPGDVQRMSAGKGVLHSEFNPSSTEPMRLLQIWILPESSGTEPGYEQKTFGDTRRNKLKLVASRDGRDGSVTVHQDVNLYASVLDDGSRVEVEIAPKRRAWVQVARGKLTVNGEALAEGDGAAIEREEKLVIEARESSEMLVFDLA